MMRSTRDSEKGKAHSTGQLINQMKSTQLVNRFEVNDDYRPKAASAPSFHLSSSPDINGPSPLLQASVTGENGFHVLDNAIPAKNKPLSIFDLNNKVRNTASASFHKVYKVKKVNAKHPDVCYFFKKNKTHSLMSVLEATACHFYQYLIPGQVPTAHAHFDDSDKTKPYIGLSSKGIPGFKSTMDDPLKPEDLKNKDIVKGLARCLAASYIFEEDDLHRGNMSKSGQRIDFDMSLWPILCNYKESGYIDWTFRYPNKMTFAFDEDDIRHFPNIKKAKPFYWPTNPPPVIPESILTVVSKVIPISKNSFRQTENDIYKLLELDDTFKYETYKTFLKYILSETSTFQGMAQLHIHDEAEHARRVIAKHQMFRIKSLKEVLLKMPEFKEFMLHHGKEAITEIKAELHEWNQKINQKMEKNPLKTELLKPLLVNLEATQDKFREVVMFFVNNTNKMK